MPVKIRDLRKALLSLGFFCGTRKQDMNKPESFQKPSHEMNLQEKKAGREVQHRHGSQTIFFTLHPWGNGLFYMANFPDN